MPLAAQYRKHFKGTALTFLDMEADAAAIRGFHFNVIPGLFQTEEYMQAMVEGSDQYCTSEMVAARMSRQTVLEGDEGPDVVMVLDEAVVRRKVGGSQVMKDQMDRLRRLNRRPRITIRVLPFDMGAHRGLFGSFSLLTPPNGTDVVYLENSRSAPTLDDNRTVVAAYHAAFEKLERQAIDLL